MKSVIATRALEGGRRGSSRPIVVETEAGTCIVKLRGAAQGTGPLVAEVMVGAIADAIGLSVPARMLVKLEPTMNIPERDAELRDLMGASIGMNLGFSYLEGARDFVLTEIDKVSAADRAAIFWLDRFVMNPDRFDVVVGSNLFGDILSDLGPAATGTIGIAPSANINPERIYPSLFEPVHGSAPDIYGRKIANPVGQIWSGAMMLDHLGCPEAGAAVVKAIETVLQEGPKTPDLGGKASTADLGKALAEAL